MLLKMRAKTTIGIAYPQAERPELHAPNIIFYFKKLLQGNS
jgi:hypothetical protein